MTTASTTNDGIRILASLSGDEGDQTVEVRSGESTGRSIVYGFVRGITPDVRPAILGVPTAPRSDVDARRAAALRILARAQLVRAKESPLPSGYYDEEEDD